LPSILTFLNFFASPCSYTCPVEPVLSVEFLFMITSLANKTITHDVSTD